MRGGVGRQGRVVARTFTSRYKNKCGAVHSSSCKERGSGRLQRGRGRAWGSALVQCTTAVAVDPALRSPRSAKGFGQPYTEHPAGTTLFRVPMRLKLGYSIVCESRHFTGLLQGDRPYSCGRFTRGPPLLLQSKTEAAPKIDISNQNGHARARRSLLRQQHLPPHPTQNQTRTCCYGQRGRPPGGP